jgi:hypothetical protein
MTDVREPSFDEVEVFIADHEGGATLDEVAAAFGVTRERIRQIETTALRKLTRRFIVAGIRDRNTNEQYFHHEEGIPW